MIDNVPYDDGHHGFSKVMVAAEDIWQVPRVKEDILAAGSRSWVPQFPRDEVDTHDRGYSGLGRRRDLRLLKFGQRK